MAQVDTYPDLSSPYAVSDAQVRSVAEKGFVRLNGVCAPEEVAPYRERFREVVAGKSADEAPLADRDTYGKAFLQIMNLWREDPVCARFACARRFARIAAELLGVDGVRMYHDQALFKEPHGGFTPWHQDQHYWPLDTDRTITMWMPLADAEEAMGVMQFAAGSHGEGYLGDMPISDESEARIKQFVEEKGFAVESAGPMKAGDATFHLGWTLHCAPENRTDRMREVMTVIYFADGTRVGPIDNANRKNDLADWLPGCQPGGPAASELNPLLYSSRA
jgi:hypothetical protein